MAEVLYVCPSCGRRSGSWFPAWHFDVSSHRPYCGTWPVKTAAAKGSVGDMPAPRPILSSGLTKPERDRLLTVHPNGDDPAAPGHSH